MIIGLILKFTKVNPNVTSKLKSFGYIN